MIVSAMVLVAYTLPVANAGGQNMIILQRLFFQPAVRSITLNTFTPGASLDIIESKQEA